ncbi:MAG: hypothetical protein BWX79_03303 [Alphaproteobacteria bacterium ADurb.Bin100]|nr:MAG: hypothetical protein BWX79_03303 [Alphaproteobacteria bacterium ADurb.Bin100]
MPPDRGITRWNSFGLAAVISGDVCSAQTLIAPADWPTTVTLSGLPPKEEELVRTNCSALMLSSIVKLPESVDASPVLSCGRFMNPRMPSRKLGVTTIALAVLAKAAPSYMGSAV